MTAPYPASFGATLPAYVASFGNPDSADAWSRGDSFEIASLGSAVMPEMVSEPTTKARIAPRYVSRNHTHELTAASVAMLVVALLGIVLTALRSAFAPGAFPVVLLVLGAIGLYATGVKARQGQSGLAI